MSDWRERDFWLVMRFLSVRIGEHGREVERSLQLAAGTCFVTLLATLPTTWDQTTYGPLRVIYSGMMAFFGLSFLCAVLAAITRTLGFAVDLNERATRYDLVSRVGVWGIWIVLSFAVMAVMITVLVMKLMHLATS